MTDTDSGAVVPVAIVGAGPAGLVLARRLRRLGVECVVLERGNAAASWHAMPPALRLVSPWWTNVLDAAGLLRHLPFAMVSAPDYAAYLDEYRRRHAIAVREHTEVRGIQLTPDCYTLDTSAGPLRARMVVCATGYFGNPRGAEPAFAHDGSIPLLHVAAMRDEATLSTHARGGRRVLLVGKRVSAGQLMVELHDAGWDVTLSCRQPLEFRRAGLAGALKDALYYFYEELLVTRHPDLQAPSFPPMDGGRSELLVRRGRVAVSPPLRNIRDGIATFEDGSQSHYDVVLLATGYRPALQWLAALVSVDAVEGLPDTAPFEVAGRPGLFCFGLANRPNYRSRTVRGMRRDARRLARTLLERLR